MNQVSRASKNAVPTIQTLTFALKGETFAVSIESIKEIIEFPDLTAVPLMPRFLKGVMNLRGAVIPVIDLSERFHLGPSEPGRRTCVVIFELLYADSMHTLGIVVDAVQEVIDILPQQIDPTPEFGTHVAAEFLRGMLRLNNKIVLMLDLDKVLAMDQLEALMVPA
jgi:purine-binding chemotaxis protein CheW